MTLADDFFEGHEGTLASRRPDQNQTDFDIEFYQQILERNCDHLDVLRRLVEIYARRGEYAQALMLERRLVRLRPADAIAHYNMACSLAMLGRSLEGLDSLDKALGLGYTDLAHMETDPDLDTLRHEPGYGHLLRKHGLVR